MHPSRVDVDGSWLESRLYAGSVRVRWSPNPIWLEWPLRRTSKHRLVEETVRLCSKARRRRVFVDSIEMEIHPVPAVDREPIGRIVRVRREGRARAPTGNQEEIEGLGTAMATRLDRVADPGPTGKIVRVPEEVPEPVRIGLVDGEDPVL